MFLHWAKLGIGYCRSVAGVSALGTVDELFIDNCYKVTDVSALCDVPNLTISNYTNITNYSLLRKECINEDYLSNSFLKEKK